jgi:D-lactate dehydrogenase
VQVKDNVAVHVPCSSSKMGIAASFMSVAQRCARHVTPSGVPCCGMAGDRGMRYPELTAAALQHLDTAGCAPPLSLIMLSGPLLLCPLRSLICVGRYRR